MVTCMCDICRKIIATNPKHIDINMYNSHINKNDIGEHNILIEADLCDRCYDALEGYIKSLFDIPMGTVLVTVDPNG